jgi:hypothetical protein
MTIQQFQFPALGTEYVVCCKRRLLLEEKLAIANRGKVRVNIAMTVPKTSAHLWAGWSEDLADGPLDSIN